MRKKLFIYFLIIISTFFNLKKDNTHAFENIKNSSPEKNLNTDYLKTIPTSDYIIGAGDQLQIIISRDYPELNSTALVNGEGQINLPLLKKVFVSGLTLDELTQLLNEAYLEFVKYPELEVYISQYRPIRITLEGEVENPGLHTLNGALSIETGGSSASDFLSSQSLDLNTSALSSLIESQLNLNPGPINPISIGSNSSDSSITNSFLNSIGSGNYYFPKVFDAIKKGGGITEFSDLENVQIIRKNPISNGGGKITTTLNFKAVLENGDEKQNIRIYDEDLIIIGRSEEPNTQVFKKAVMSNLNPKFINVFVAGRVVIPGRTLVSKASTLSDAIDMAGGTRALKGPVRFVRFNNDGTVDKRKFKFRSSASRGSYKNPVLRNGDLIVVGTSLLNLTNEVITEITAPFSSLFSTYALIEALSD